MDFGVGNSVTSEARAPPGAEPTVSDTVGEKGGKASKAYIFHAFLDFTCRFGLFMSGGPSLAASLRVTKTNCI